MSFFRFLKLTKLQAIELHATRQAPRFPHALVLARRQFFCHQRGDFVAQQIIDLQHNKTHFRQREYEGGVEKNKCSLCFLCIFRSLIF
ncbi:MAG: hypothetical protein DKINENOH_01663 [bacterium]|nr:hypothetical protein [bacterium]